MAVTPFTIAEVRIGWALKNWGHERVAAAEEQLKSCLLIPLDEMAFAEFVRLRVHCRQTGKRPQRHRLLDRRDRDLAGDPARYL